MPMKLPAQLRAVRQANWSNRSAFALALLHDEQAVLIAVELALSEGGAGQKSVY